MTTVTKVEVPTCPECQTELTESLGFLYCPVCEDVIYNFQGEEIGRFE